MQKNEYKIDETQELSTLAPLEEDKEVVWYYVESLFTNNLVKEWITSQIKLKLIFKRLSLNINLLFRSVFTKKIGGSLSGTFSGIYTLKLENDIV